MMAHRGLPLSQSWRRADFHAGPEQKLHQEAEYIDAALTFVSLPTSSCDARPDHTNGTKRKEAECLLKAGTPDVPERSFRGTTDFSLVDPIEIAAPDQLQTGSRLGSERFRHDPAIACSARSIVSASEPWRCLGVPP
jgi:hypothetical protein